MNVSITENQNKFNHLKMNFFGNAYLGSGD